MARPRKDLTGATRGKLKIISIDQEKGKWMCKCECGNIIYLSSHEWFYNQPSSCGCAKRKDITDKKYGLLTAKYPTGELDKFRRALWYCECECGGHKIVTTTDLEAGLVKSCGCLYKDNQKNIGRVAKEWLKDGTDLRKINAIHPYKGNSTGFRGVVKNKKTGRYSATIFFKGKITRLGTYDTPEEASAAYLKAKENLQSEYQNELSETRTVPTHHSIIKKGKKKLVYYTPENRYVNITELSKLSGVNRVTLYSRLDRGYQGEELWSAKHSPRTAKIYVDYDGKSVTLAELSALTGMNEKLLRVRYSKGLRGEKLWSAAENKRDAKIIVKYEDKEVNLQELSIITGISYQTLYQRYRKGLRDEELWSTNRTPTNEKPCVDYHGKQVTITELSRLTGKKRNTLDNRYKNGLRGEELWNDTTKMIVDYEGKEVNLQELSIITGISYQTLRLRYKKGLRDENLVKEIKKDVTYIEYNGEQVTLHELSRKSGIEYNTLYMRYARGERGKKLWRNIDSKIKIDYLGKPVTLNELSKITKIAYNTLLYRYSNGDRSEDLWRPVGQRKKNKKK